MQKEVSETSRIFIFVYILLRGEQPKAFTLLFTTHKRSSSALNLPEKRDLELDWMESVRLQDLSIVLHKVYVFRDNQKCNHPVIFNNLVTANTIFKNKNPEIRIPPSVKSAILKGEMSISENFFFLLRDNLQVNERLLSGKVPSGYTYAKNSKFFNYFETEMKKVCVLTFRKIVLFVKRKKPR